MWYAKAYRQEASAFRAELDKLLAIPEGARSGRLFVNERGHRSRSVPSKTHEERMTLYGYERFESVARILGIFELMRDIEHLETRRKPVEPTASPAVWQAFKGTEEFNACHTCPTHLQLNGHLPTMQTRNLGLQRHMVIEFANCISMPRAINEIDKVLDERAGKSSFIEAATVVLNERGATWQQGLAAFRDGVTEFLGPARELLFEDPKRSFVFRSPEDQQRVDMVFAYYEGIFLTPLNVHSVRAMLAMAKSEAERES
jgi:hypothetical protein